MLHQQRPCVTREGKGKILAIEKSIEKIDGAVVTIMALGRALRIVVI